jgi:cysteine desulfurase
MGAAKAVVDRRARRCAARRLLPRDVVFTSGGTEANNLALCARSAQEAEGVCVTSRLEHPSITAVAELLERRGVRVVWLDAPASGRIDPEHVDRALALAEKGPRLVALSAVNHETGVIQPVADVAIIARRRGADLHVDAVQAAGRLGPEAWQGADSVSLAAHKMRGPKGIGALAVRAGITIRPLLRGGGQERGLRPGTVDPVAVAGFGVAARLAEGGPDRYQRLAPLRQSLEDVSSHSATGSDAPLERHPPRSPCSNLSWAGWPGRSSSQRSTSRVCVSAGAPACGTPSPRVIAAMLGDERAKSAVRAPSAKRRPRKPSGRDCRFRTCFGADIHVR